MGGLFDFLHDDIGFTILSCMPQKSLLKFRSVSKSWRHTIDASPLRELHNNRRRNNIDVDDLAFLQLISPDDGSGTWKLSMWLVDSQKPCYYDFPYHDFFKNNYMDGGAGHHIKLCGPVHGLVCLYREHSIALCNPSLGKIKILPPSEKNKYDHNLNHFLYVGFGYDNDKKDYKVVQMWRKGSEGRTVVEVYSRRENKWRVLADHPPVHSDLFLTIWPISRLWPWISARMVYWYGIKWGTGGEPDSVILLFDMHSEAFKMVAIPFVENSRQIDIVVKEDSILLFTFVTTPPLDVDIWEYKRDWTRQSDEVGSWMNDGLVFKISSDSKLVLYDFFSKKEIKSIDLVAKLYESESEIEYMGSFVSP